jgi:hypothetical protein
MRPEVGLRISGSTLSLTATGLHAGQAYQLQRSPDLSTWDDVQTLSPVSGNLVLALTNDAAQAFYRLKW